MKHTVSALLVLILISSAGCASHSTNEVQLPVNLQENLFNVAQYYEKGAYDRDVKAIVAKVDDYIDQSLKTKTYHKPAIVFDIDETLLNNQPMYQQTGYRFIPSVWKRWVDSAEIPAVDPVRDLYLKYVDRVDVFIVTGRNVFQRAQTMRNLKNRGIHGATMVFFKEAWDKDLTALEYKTKVVQQLVDKEGYEVIANIGDQSSDFGATIQGTNFKLPNYLYISR